MASDKAATELGGRAELVTNNQMELQAAIQGLTHALNAGAKGITVYSDSSYVIGGITKWIHGWQKNGWKTAAKEPVLNVELWKRLIELAQSPGIKISWRYVGGHIGVAGNERADEIASAFADGKNVVLYKGPLSGYAVDLLNLEHDGELRAAKSASRSRSKRAVYSYVSEVGGAVQTHKTWAECEARVKGKKARFKKVFSAEEEKQVVGEFGR